jgi:hypothetical protein
MQIGADSENENLLWKLHFWYSAILELWHMLVCLSEKLFGVFFYKCFMVFVMLLGMQQVREIMTESF